MDEMVFHTTEWIPVINQEQIDYNQHSCNNNVNIAILITIPVNKANRSYFLSNLTLLSADAIYAIVINKGNSLYSASGLLN